MPTLHEAIFNNDLTFVKSLLASSPDLNAADPHSGKTPIQLAIELKRYAILEAIFEYDTTDAINTARMSGQPLLCYAAFNFQQK